MYPLFCMMLTQLTIFGVVLGILKSSSILLLSICIFSGALSCFCIMGSQTSNWPRRTDVWFVSRWTFALIWFVSLIGYIVYFFAYPDSFSFSSSQLWFIAPCISFAPAFLSVVLTMCAGDTALLILEKEEP